MRTGGTADSEGITAFANGGNATVTSNIVITTGNDAEGIQAFAVGGNASVTSASVTTSGSGSDGIFASATGNASVTSTTVSTTGANAIGIYAQGGGTVVVSSTTVTTTGAGSIGIFARETGGPGGGGASISGGAAVLGPNGGITITAGNTTTSGAGAHGIDALAAGGDVEVTSTGALSTSGANANGVNAVSQNGFVTVDVNNVSVTGAGGTGLFVNAATTSTITVRGLLLAANGFEINADGGASTVNTTASGIIRGAVDLTGNADRVNNAGTFDAIGTSQFGAGTDVFNNSGLVTSFNGAAVFAGLETFNNTGRVDMRDSAVGDTLNVTGAYVGSGASRLQLDANNQIRVADVLITGAATGSTTLDVNLVAPPVFDLIGTLVVDASTGTSSTAFTLGAVSQSNPYVRLGLLFDAPNNNFLLVAGPDQPVFESVMTGEALINFWYNSADAVTSQLDTTRDGNNAPSGGNLAGGGRFGGWVQLRAGNVERDASQSFTSGGSTTVFNTSFDQDFQGVQGGLDYQAGNTIFGITFGLERSEVDFDASLNGLDMDGMNFGVYAAFSSGSFFFNALGKVDWVDVDAEIGGGIATQFDATAWGLRGNAGFHFNMGRAFIEPALSLSWVNVDIDNYTSAGASVAFDDIESFRGALGVRFGGDFQVGPHSTLSPYVGIAGVEEFQGDVQNNFTLGNSIFLNEEGPGTFGELSAGATLRSGSVEAFVRGELDFGGERDGIEGRAGIRIRF